MLAPTPWPEFTSRTSRFSIFWGWQSIFQNNDIILGSVDVCFQDYIFGSDVVVGSEPPWRIHHSTSIHRSTGGQDGFNMDIMGIKCVLLAPPPNYRGQLNVLKSGAQ